MNPTVRLVLWGVCLTGSLVASAQSKKIVLIAGAASHGSGEHEFKAGCHLLERCLKTVPGVEVQVHTGGWPAQESALDGAAAIVIYSDGGKGHPAIQGDRLKVLSRRLGPKTGLACLHYAVEVPKEQGGAEFLQWLGGYFEMHWSVNPTWTATFLSLPSHPITRGVKPFAIQDEWYFHMRFADGMRGVTPILTAMPPASTMQRPDGPHSGNPAVRAAIARGEPQHVAWAHERADGGRGFGFTGAHYHRNWADANFRKVVLNAILWVAQVEVPTDGVVSPVTPAELNESLDAKGEKKKVSVTPPVRAPQAETFVSPTTGTKK